MAPWPITRVDIVAGGPEADPEIAEANAVAGAVPGGLPAEP